MDVLSDVFKSLHLESNIFARPRFLSPWGLYQPKSVFAAFHFITRGNCYLKLDGESQFRSLKEGDFVLLPQGAGHVITDSPNTPVEDMEVVFGNKSAEEIEEMVIGGYGVESRIICGAFNYERGEAHPLLSNLPPLIHIQGQSMDGGNWIGSTLNLVASEVFSRRPGSEEIVTRMLDVLFVQIIRSCIESVSDKNEGWLAGLQDAQIGRALAWIHRQFAFSWTVESLAQKAGMSRSAFSARFSELVGDSPVQYLNKWRIQKAIALFRDTDQSLRSIGYEVGYQSEEVFSRTFKRILHTTPGAYRKQLLQRLA
ncbi:MAG: hypothetical protein COB67_12995 [SAR324 cluster bacterium]|uniref:HTH araC/xylS-type domain-containing protein n=1 Tax=SAR324 cluster bacterium TaxID=2024889 RepID=A0A2A4SPA4_9DELT|nr:MAG: hypothetical protein COB67_12995 [SAR324 cluster bacterium]